MEQFLTDLYAALDIEKSNYLHFFLIFFTEIACMEFVIQIYDNNTGI